MPRRNIFIFDSKESPWIPFLKEFFEDTRSVCDIRHPPVDGHRLFHGPPYDLAFVNPSLVYLAMGQKMNAHRATHPEFRVVGLGAPAKCDVTLDGSFPEPPPLPEFQKKILEIIPLPDVIRVLIVDDEPEIGAMFQDYLEARIHPAFKVDYAPDGQQGLQAMQHNLPDVLILDIKMPVTDGREVYRQMDRQGLKIPVIIFFDAISGDEMADIRKIGRPAVVEKGSRQSSMPEIMSLIKKMAYFG